LHFRGWLRWLFAVSLPGGTMRWGRIAKIVAIAACAFYVLIFWPLRNPHPPEVAGRGALVIGHAKIYTSPDTPPIEDGTILVRDGLITAVGRDLAVPPDARLLPCNRCVVTAGFWNAHVHFTEPKWEFADWKSAATLNRQLADMLTSRGFTTVTWAPTCEPRFPCGGESRRAICWDQKSTRRDLLFTRRTEFPTT
jgi:hypothetical protein